MTPRVGVLVAMGRVDGCQRRAAKDPSSAAQTPQPVFRLNTDLVTVPVFVKGSAGAAAGLTSADFVLTDNGVPQQVETIDSEAMPVDVTVLVETSRALKDYAALINEQVRRIAGAGTPRRSSRDSRH